MDYDESIQRALAELKQATGLSLEVRRDSGCEKSRILEQLRLLNGAYREKYNKIHFLQSLLAGGIPSYSIQERARGFHIDPEESRILYLVESGGTPDNMLREILRELFPSQADTYLIPVSESLTAVLCSCASVFRDRPGSSAAMSFARTIVDTLNAEAFTRIRVSYSKKLTSLTELPSAFQEASLALKVGTLFRSEQTVFPWDHLGVVRLIYRLPFDLCEDFLHEIFGSDIPAKLDEETSVTASQFFQNNLNIAETSRQLHVHRNTLIYRLEQIQHRTGLDLRRFEDAATFKIAAMVINYLRTERKLHP